jgi:hypothetical protein
MPAVQWGPRMVRIVSVRVGIGLSSSEQKRLARRIPDDKFSDPAENQRSLGIMRVVSAKPRQDSGTRADRRADQARVPICDFSEPSHRGDLARKRLLGPVHSVLRQPCKSFLAGRKSGKFAAGETSQVLEDPLRKVLDPHECGFLDKGLVKGGGFFQDPDGFRVKRCSREIGKSQD